MLRVARFAARFHGLGFQIADETLERMRAIAETGEVDTLTPERVFLELQRALMESAPEVFVAALAACGAWPAIFPQLPDTAAIEQTLRESAAAQSPLPVRFACLSWHSRDVDAWCQAIRAPRRLAQAARLLHRHFSTWSNLDSNDPSAVLALLESLDAVRRPQQLEDFSAAAAVLSTVLELDCEQIRPARARCLRCSSRLRREVCCPANRPKDGSRASSRGTARSRARRLNGKPVEARQAPPGTTRTASSRFARSSAGRSGCTAKRKFPRSRHPELTPPIHCLSHVQRFLQG